MKTAIITGAAGSLGAALTRQLAQSGVTVVMVDKNERALERLYDDLIAQGLEEPVIHLMDLATLAPGDVSVLLDSVVRELGGLDLLVHCAARFEGLRPQEQFPPDEWLLHMQVNLNAAWLLSSQSIPLLRDSEQGRLVFMIEDLDRVQKSNWGAYGASKHALAAMVNQLVMEVGHSGLKVVGFDPGPFQSPLRAEAYLAEDPTLLRNADDVAKQIFAYLDSETLESEALVSLQAS